MTGFSERLRAERKRLELTQEQLADYMEVTKSAVSAWERGAEKPGFRLLPKLSKVLGVSLDALICGTEEEMPVEEHVIQTPNEDEERLLKAYRKLSVRRRKGLLELLDVS